LIDQFSFSGLRSGCSMRISLHWEMIVGKKVWSIDSLNSCRSTMWLGVI
jgi:hypothetical protein